MGTAKKGLRSGAKGYLKLFNKTITGRKQHYILVDTERHLLAYLSQATDKADIEMSLRAERAVSAKFFLLP